MSTASHAQTPARERAILLTLGAVQFTHILDFMIMMPLGSQLMRVFQISPGQFSRLVAAYAISAAAMGFLGGFVLDRFDRKHALLTLYVGFAGSTLACALAPTYHALLIARACAGAFGGVASSVVTAMVGDVVPPERRGRAMGLVMAAFPIASVLGIPLGLLLAERFQWHAPFFLLAGLAVVVFTVGLRVLPQLEALHAPTHPWRQMKAILSHRVHQRGFMVSAALVFAGGLIIPFLAPTMVANVGLQESQLSLIYAAGGISTFITTPIVGRLADRFDKLHVLGCLTVGASGAVLLVTHLGPTSVAIAMLVSSIFMVTMSGRFAPAMAMITNAVDGRFRGGFMSVNSAVQQAAGGLANVVAGALITTDAAGHLVGYGRVGWLSVVFFGLTVWLAARLRAAAPHAAKSRQLPISSAVALD